VLSRAGQRQRRDSPPQQQTATEKQLQLPADRQYSNAAPNATATVMPIRQTSQTATPTATSDRTRKHTLLRC